MSEPQPLSEGQFELSLEVSLSRRDYTGERIHISERVNVNAKTFLEVAKILSLFHDLAESLKAKR